MATRQFFMKFRKGGDTQFVDSTVLDSLNYGSGVEDSVRFDTINGRTIQFNWAGVLFTQEQSVPVVPDLDPGPPPPVDWDFDIIYQEMSGPNEFSISTSTKDAILAALMGPGSEDMIVTFDTLNGKRIHCPSKSFACVVFKPV